MFGCTGPMVLRVHHYIPALNDLINVFSVTRDAEEC